MSSDTYDTSLLNIHWWSNTVMTLMRRGEENVYFDCWVGEVEKSRVIEVTSIMQEVLDE